MKRKYGDRANWKRIVDRDYVQTYLKEKTFQGHITLLHMNKVTEKLTVTYGGKNICIVANGYSWLQQFPDNQHHSITTTFDEKGEIVQWYIDISLSNGIENNIPYTDDLYLDIVVLPSGEVILLDEEELEVALITKRIDQNSYDLAWKEAKELIQAIKEQTFRLLSLAREHKDILFERLKEQKNM